ncbi:MAG: SLATT domain-containing protein [Gallionella sp.]
MPSLVDIAKNLKDRIWFTRIARIYSEKRLLRNELHSQLLLMFYAVYSIALSVTQLKYKPIPDDAAAVFGIILSVILFGLTFHMSSKGFPARAQRFKENYTHLQELLGRLEVAECQADLTKLQEVIEHVQVEYKTAITNSENHTTMDDRCARFPYGKKGTSRALTSWDYTCVLAYSAGRYVSLGLLYASPVVIYSYMLCAME